MHGVGQDDGPKLPFSLEPAGLGSERPPCVQAAALCAAKGASRLLAINRCADAVPVSLSAACDGTATGWKGVTVFNASLSSGPGREWAMTEGPAESWGPLRPTTKPAGRGDSVPAEPFSLSVIELDAPAKPPPAQPHRPLKTTDRGAASNGAPAAPPEPVLPVHRTFAGDEAWIRRASVFILGSSRQFIDGNALFTPNMQPGGYSGEFMRDYSYGLINTPWQNNSDAAPWNLTLDGFLWSSEQLIAKQRADGTMPDAWNFGHKGLANFNMCSQQYCTFPPDSPLPRPSCCTHGNCSTGSMDNAAFAVFNILFLVRAIEAERGSLAAQDLLAQWVPALARGLQRVPSGPGRSVRSRSPPSALLCAAVMPFVCRRPSRTTAPTAQSSGTDSRTPWPRRALSTSRAC